MTETNSAANDPQGQVGAPQSQIPGVILRAHDGTIYFVPDRALNTFKVTSSNGISAIEAKFDAIESGSQAAPHLDAYHVSLPDTLFGHAEIFR